MLSGEYIKDLVLVQTHPKEIIEYIQKLEAQIVDNHNRLGKEIDRLEKLLSQQLTNPFQESTAKPYKWTWDWKEFTTTSATPFTIDTTSGT